MERLPISVKGQTVYLDGYPDAEKIVKLTGPKSRRLADLKLHETDLAFTLECLEAINQAPEQPRVLREALWRCAIVHFIKCFGYNRARFSLHPKKIYKGDAQALKIFEYFDSLRNMHIVHDENSYLEALPGAVLNKKGKGEKIAKIFCSNFTGKTLVQSNYSNLHRLATLAREWVAVQFDEVCAALRSELEAKPYEELLALDKVHYKVPGADDVHRGKTQA